MDKGHDLSRRKMLELLGAAAFSIPIGLLWAIASFLLSLGAVPAAAVEWEVPPPIEIHRAVGQISVDGDLSDPGWTGAAAVESFFETSPGNNVAPPVLTRALLAYDERYLYVGLLCADSVPSNVRAPFVDRDNIATSDDSVTLFLDSRGDRRSAMVFRVDPRGQQADGVFDDASQSEDLSPDFFFDSASRFTAAGWQAEIRIPFSSLRYSKDSTRAWGILIERNYPRNFRSTIASVPIPRNANCLVCRSASLTGIAGLPGGGNFVAAPYATLSRDAVAGSPPGSPLRTGRVRGNAGVDLKWTPSAGTALDATVNPDFSQIESDVGQIAVNNRFALYFPEKRPFFLEGVDLLQTPLQVISSRTITSPRWGARATGKWDSSSYTMLVAQDRGGGSVVVPGPTESVSVPQDFSSIAAIGRLRSDFGASFAGVLATDRENAPAEGGGHNRVLGADFQWSWGVHDRVKGQFLASDTRTPDRPDLFPDWDGRRFSSRAFSVEWAHNDPQWHLRAIHQELGDGFRADDGYIPQVGFRHEKIVAAYNAYDLGALSRIQSGIYCDYFARPSGELIQRQCGFYASPNGIRNLGGEIDLTIGEKDRIRDTTVDSKWNLSFYGLSVDPGPILSRISLSGFLGESPDVVNARPGRGGDLNLTATLKPTLHLQLDFNGDRQWLNVEEQGAQGRLFTAQIERLKATYNFSSRSFLRAIGEYQNTTRDPRLYTAAVDPRSSSFSGSFLLAYRLDWQTVAFLGYGDEREGDFTERLHPTRRSVFLKVSYAFQR